MGGETKNGVALFVPKLAFTGESSTLQRWQFLLTEKFRFCAFLPQIKAQLMKTAPQFTLSRFSWTASILAFNWIFFAHCHSTTFEPPTSWVKGRIRTIPISFLSFMDLLHLLQDRCRRIPHGIHDLRRFDGNCFSPLRENPRHDDLLAISNPDGAGWALTYEKTSLCLNNASVGHTASNFHV